MSAENPGGLRVVLDTNVYFSALSSPGGVPFQIWKQAVKRQYTLLISPAIIREVGQALREDLRWPETHIIRYLKLLAKVGEIVMPRQTLEAVPDDPDDNRILECAVAGRADLIVSGDRHLRRLKTFHGIGIVRPVDFYRTLGL